MPDMTSEPLRGALGVATRVGLRLRYPGGQRPWARLSCPACGAALDIPLGDDRPTGLSAMRAVRRITNFVIRHQSGRAHQ